MEHRGSSASALCSFALRSPKTPVGMTSASEGSGLIHTVAMVRGTVTLKEASLVRGMHEGEFQWIRFVNDLASPNPEVAIGRWFQDLVSSTEQLGGGAVGDPGVMGYFPLDPKTTVIALQYATSKRTLLAECGRLARYLEDAGCTGTLQGAPSATRRWMRHPHEKLVGTAVVGSINTRPWRPRNGDPQATGRIMCDPAALDAVIDHSISWCTVAGGRFAVIVGGYAVDAPAAQAASMFRSLVTATGENVELVCSNYPSHTRIVTLDYQARVRYGEGRTEHLEPGTPTGPDKFPDPHASVALATDLLTKLAPHLTYGFGLQAVLPGAIASDLLHRRWPQDRPMHRMSVERRWETQAGWDAFAVLLHGPDFPPIGQQGPYRATPLAGHRQLLTHHNAPALINGSALTPDDLTHARTQLGPALIDPQAVQQVLIAWQVHRGEPDAIATYGPGPHISNNHPMKTW